MRFRVFGLCVCLVLGYLLTNSGCKDKNSGPTGPTKLDTVTDWHVIISDDTLESDGIGVIPRDLKEIDAGNTGSQLGFRVKTTRGWNEYKSPAEGIDVAIFIDADQNDSTGKTSVSSYSINDIGADYRCIIGLHGDSVAAWNGSNWVPAGNGLPDFLNISDSSNSFEVGINLNRLGSPQAVDVVVANVTNQQQTPLGRWDWAPNQGGGHGTYIIDSASTGSINASAYATPRQRRPLTANLPNPFD